jgi:integrase
MKARYRLIRRGLRGGTFYCVDTETKRRESLKTSDPDVAAQIIEAKNIAVRQPAINVQIASAYLSASDPEAIRRTWQTVMNAAKVGKRGNTLKRWETAMEDAAFDLIRNLPLLQTRPEHFVEVLRRGTVSTNVFLRRLHNFALDMEWLPKSILPKRQWPKVEYGEKRAITVEEQEKILQSEQNPNWRDYYELIWHLGGSQTDVALLTAEDVDWNDWTIAYARMKTDSPALLHFGATVAEILRRRPERGFLFPHIAHWKESDRAKAFIRRCKLAGVSGVTLHCYRYSWAERARVAGMPERFAQEAIGHNSKAVQRSYAKKAKVKIPSLEEYEKKVVQMPTATAA